MIMSLKSIFCDILLKDILFTHCLSHTHINLKFNIYPYWFFNYSLWCRDTTEETIFIKKKISLKYVVYNALFSSCIFIQFLIII